MWKDKKKEKYVELYYISQHSIYIYRYIYYIFFGGEGGGEGIKTARSIRTYFFSTERNQGQENRAR